MISLIVGRKIFMLNYKESTTLLEEFTTPLKPLLLSSSYRRNCPKINDEQWVITGLLRVFSQEVSSRGFLQQLFDQMQRYIPCSSFFKSLHSKRRLLFCQDLNERLVASVKCSNIEDPLKSYSSLSKYDIYAGDGHYRAAAVHDKKICDKKYAVGHFYVLNLRTRMLTHLDSMMEESGRKREHDMHLLKRMTIQQLRQGTRKGQKVIYVWDSAGIDLLQWHKWKKGSGIYFISLEKENMKPYVIGEPEWDRQDPINAGVIADEYIGTSTQTMMRRIRYKCPVSGKSFHFITSVMNVEPGLIAHLYKMRWNIEKIFDELKTKLTEKKAWANGSTARNMQAQFTCLMHNLMVLLESQIAQNENITDAGENKRRLKRLELLKLKAKKQGYELPLAQQQLHLPTQRSQKFIRWLRNHCFFQTSYQQAIDTLQRIYRPGHAT